MIRAIFNPSDIKTLGGWIKESTRAVVCCHVRPDGDAMGSSLGMAWILAKLGIKVRVVTPDAPPRSLNFLPGMSDVVPLSKYPEFAPQLINDADIIFCCDFNKPSRTDLLGSYISNAKGKKILVDHHQDPEDFCNLKFSFPSMSSASELCFRLICALGYANLIDAQAATCLATGVITDTRNLSVNSDDPEIYLVLYDLLSRGVDKKQIIRETLEQKSADAFNLQVYALDHCMTYVPEVHSAIICLDKDTLQKFKYVKGDTEGLVNQPLQIKGICSSFFLREDSDCIKISSRSVERFPVSKVCEDLFGGGGHLQAAGGEFHGTLDEAYKKLVNALPLYAEYLDKPCRE